MEYTLLYNFDFQNQINNVIFFLIIKGWEEEGKAKTESKLIHFSNEHHSSLKGKRKTTQVIYKPTI